MDDHLFAVFDIEEEVLFVFDSLRLVDDGNGGGFSR